MGTRLFMRHYIKYPPRPARQHFGSSMVVHIAPAALRRIGQPPLDCTSRPAIL
jgi:hypothetical protein